MRLAVWVSELDLDCQTCRARGQGKCTFGGIEFEGDRTKGCPAEAVKADSYEYLRWYGFYKQALLPNEGPITRQPHKLVSAFSLIDAEIEKMRKEKAARKEQKSWTKTKSR